MALNSMCATACSSAARPSGVCGERRGTWCGDTRRGRAGRPGSAGGSPNEAVVSIGAGPSSQARVPAALVEGSLRHNNSRARRRSSIARLWPSATPSGRRAARQVVVHHHAFVLRHLAFPRRLREHLARIDQSGFAPGADAGRREVDVLGVVLAASRGASRRTTCIVVLAAPRGEFLHVGGVAPRRRQLLRQFADDMAQPVDLLLARDVAVVAAGVLDVLLPAADLPDRLRLGPVSGSTADREDQRVCGAGCRRARLRSACSSRCRRPSTARRRCGTAGNAGGSAPEAITCAGPAPRRGCRSSACVRCRR